MSAAEDRSPDLTTTINLSSLRAVGDPFGDLLERADSETLAVLSALPANAAMLVTLNGPGKGGRYLLDAGETQIGRARESGIYLDDVTVSRKHAIVVNELGSISFADLGSLNGSYLNGRSVSSAELKHGDELQIGKFRLHLFIGGKK